MKAVLIDGETGEPLEIVELNAGAPSCRVFVVHKPLSVIPRDDDAALDAATVTVAVDRVRKTGSSQPTFLLTCTGNDGLAELRFAYERTPPSGHPDHRRWCAADDLRQSIKSYFA